MLEDVAMLESWLREDAAHVRMFAELGMLEWHLLCELAILDAAAVSSAVREAEEDSEVDADVLTLVEIGGRASRASGRSFNFRKTCEVAGFLVLEGLRTKGSRNFAMAALLAIGVLLCIVVFGGGGGSERQEVVTHPPSGSDVVHARRVATLTSLHEARWASTVRYIDDELVVGQTLTLIHGFAEVTTRRGAVAILEAPCTVEFIDNDNGLRLHSGKLLAVCEPDSSKGFLVRTPHMDVVDLGTRFGINAAQHIATDVHVFDGEVEVAMQAETSHAPLRERLVAGQAVRAMARTDHWVAIGDVRSSFAGLMTIADTILPRGATEAGIAALSGDVVWSPGSEYLGIVWTQWQKDVRAHVFEELATFRFPSDVPVTLLGPGSTRDLGPSLPARSIPGGTKVRTYIVVLFPGVPGQTATPRGSITFEGEVIGIATNVSQDRVIKGLVGDPSRLAPIQNIAGQWVDLYGESITRDLVAIEDDRRTVTFSFSGGGVATDAVRVFVRVP